MPAVAAAAITGITSLIGAKVVSNASRNAANQQTTAANHSADVQSETAAQTLAWQKQQAEAQWRNDEAARKANYDQWRARQSSISAMGTEYGLAPFDPPDYVPSQDPYGPSATISGATGGAPTTGGNDSTAQATFDSLFPGADLSPEQLVAREGDLSKAGIKVLRNAAGVAGKIQLPSGVIIDVIQGAGSGLNRKQWHAPSSTATGTAAPTANPYAATLAQAAQAGTSGLVGPAPKSAPVPTFTDRRYPVGSLGSLQRY